MRDISHGKTPSRKFYSHIWVNTICLRNLDHQETAANLLPKKPRLIRRITAAARSAISASPHFFLGRAHYRPFPRQQKKASSRPTCPSVSRNAIKSSERMRMRTGAQSGLGSSRERATGSQKRRNKLPIGVPGPVRQSRSFSSFEIIGASSLESQIGSCVVVRVVRPDEVGAQMKQRAV